MLDNQTPAEVLNRTAENYLENQRQLIYRVILRTEMNWETGEIPVLL